MKRKIRCTYHGLSGDVYRANDGFEPVGRVHADSDASGGVYFARCHCHHSLCLSSGTWEGVVCGVCVSILQFVLGIALYYGPWSVLLDYVLPLAVCGLASLIKIVRVRNVNLYLGVIMSMVLKYLCHFASGAFLFGSYVPEGMHPVIYSLGYNLPYNLATLVVAYIAVTLLYPVLHKALRFSK